MSKSATLHSSSGDLVPIVLGGPWKHGGKDWEHQPSPRSWRMRCSTGGYCARDGMVFYYSVSSKWEETGDAAEGSVIYAPKGWKPTPATIPEGCFVKTPEGVERCCFTCSGYGSEGCLWYYDNAKCFDSGDHLPKWCPKADAKVETPAVEIGDWVWLLEKDGKPADEEPRKIKSVDSTLRFGADFTNGGAWEHDRLRLVKVEDKVRIVDNPISTPISIHLHKGEVGTVLELMEMEPFCKVGLSEHWHYVDRKDLRLVEKK